MGDLLTAIFGQVWWLVLATAIYSVCYYLFGDLYEKEPSRKRLAGYLIQNTWPKKYRQLLGSLLDWFDARLTPEIKDKDWRPDEARAAWSHGMLNLSLLLAVVYPIVSVIVYWAVTNQDGRIGALIVVEGGSPAWRRAAAIGLLAGAILFATIARRAQGRTRLVLSFVAFGLAIAFSVAVASAVAGSVAVAFAGAFAVAVAAAVIFSVIVAVAGAVASAVGVAFSVAVAFAGAFALAVPVTVLGAFAFALAVAFAVENFGRRSGKRALWLVIFAVVMLSAVASALRLSAPERADAKGLILFLAILPLLNALADFASTGLTRWRLRKGLAGRMWREMLIDLGGALAAFFLLGAASILAIDWMRWADGGALFDLPGFFTDLRANPGHYWWLYFTLFSTLIPTLLHGAVALFGSLIHWWGWLRGFIVEGLDAGGKGDVVAGRLAVQALCLSMTFSAVVPVVLLVHVALYHGIVGGIALDLFEGFARLVGAIPPA